LQFETRVLQMQGIVHNAFHRGRAFALLDSLNVPIIGLSSCPNAGACAA